MKKNILHAAAVAVTVFLLCSTFVQSAYAAPEMLDQGTAGTLRFEVTFDENTDELTTLSVYGTGAIPDYSPSLIGSNAPWMHSKEELADNPYLIMKLYLERGITRIGDYAFAGSAYGSVFLYEPVEIPDTVTYIGKGAFAGNYFSHDLSEAKIEIPDSVEFIGDGAIEHEVTIVCSESSAAYLYALKNGNELIIPEGEFDDKDVEPLDEDEDEYDDIEDPSDKDGGDDGTGDETDDPVPTQTPEKKPEVVPKAPAKTKYYTVRYVLNKGKNNAANKKKYKAGSSLRLKAPVRKKYTFSGWYTDAAFRNKVTVLKNKNYKVYAKWTKVSTGRVAAPTLKSPAKKKLQVSFKAVPKAKGYQIQYSQKKNFKGAKSKLTKKRTATLKVKSGKTWYVRVRAYKLDSTGNKVYGAWSRTKKKKVK